MFIPTQIIKSERPFIKVEKAFNLICTFTATRCSLSYALNAASLMDKTYAEKFFDRVEDLVGQADDIDGKFLSVSFLILIFFIVILHFTLQNERRLLFGEK